MGPRVVEVESFKRFGEALWYPSIATDCDRCQQPIESEADVALEGAPGRPQMAQPRLICRDCLTEQAYGKLGAWLVAHLASGGQKEKDRGFVCKPIKKLLHQLATEEALESSAARLSYVLDEGIHAPETHRRLLEKALENTATFVGGEEEGPLFF